MSALRSCPRLSPSVASSRSICVRSFTSSALRNDVPRTPYEDILKTVRPRLSNRSPSSARPSLATRTAEGPQASSESRSAIDQRDPIRFLQRNIRETSAKRGSVEARLEAARETADYQKQMTRRWREGDVYAPHDLSGVEMTKWRKGQVKSRPKTDIFDMLKTNPVNHYWNFSLMSEYMTEVGKIKHSNETGLRPVNQRKMAKAIRRAIGLGLMPSVHKHPEILASNQRSASR